MNYFVLEFQVFLLILVRINSMMVSAPFYSSGVIPFGLKALLSFFISLIIFPVVSVKGLKIPPSMGEYYILVLQQVVIGVYIGFLVSIIFAAFQLSGQFFAVQIGFGINEVLDPIGQVSVPVIGQLKNLIALLVFLTINGHHYMIEAVYRSFELAPYIAASKGSLGALLKYLVYSFSGMFVIALKISLPVVATVFLISVSMGILAKAAPQMNIMMLGFPFKIIVAFAVMIIISPLIIRIMVVSMERVFKFMSGVLAHWPA